MVYGTYLYIMRYVAIRNSYTHKQRYCYDVYIEKMGKGKPNSCESGRNDDVDVTRII